MLLKRIKWAIVRCWLKNVRRWNEQAINAHLVLKQSQKYPERWETLVRPTERGTRFTEQPSKEEKERWFDEKMLRRPRNNGTRTLE